MHLLHIEHVAFLSVCMLLVLTNFWMHRSIPGIYRFAAYNALVLLGAVAVMLRGTIPDSLSILVGTLAVVIGYFFLFFSLQSIFGDSPLLRNLQIALVLVALVTMVQYGAVHPDTHRRLIVYSLILALQHFSTALLVLLRASRPRRKYGIPLMVILFLLGLANIARVTGVHALGAPTDYLNSGPFLQAIVILTSCLQCGVIVAFGWITSALLRQDLEHQATTDPLTGLLNRRAIEAAAERALFASQRNGTKVSAITMDLDGFKQINDTHGHHCGDAALIAVGRCLLSHIRKNDLLARVGGDEFLVVLPETSVEVAKQIAEHLRGCVEALEIQFGESTIRITTSMGFAELTDDSSSSWDHLMMRCDQALYTVKRAGGNRVLASTN